MEGWRTTGKYEKLEVQRQKRGVKAYLKSVT